MRRPSGAVPAASWRLTHLRHILDVRVDGAGTVEEIRDKPGKRHLDAAVGGKTVSLRVVGGGIDRCGGVRRLLHTERIEDVALEHRVPVSGTLGLGDDAARKDVGDVGVGEGRAEARHWLDVAQGVNERRPVHAKIAELVVDVGRQPGTLREQVKKTKLPRDPRIAHLEIRVEIDDAIVPTELAPVDGDRHRCREKRLRRRSDLKDRPRVDRGAALAPDAEALGIDQLVAGDDADCEPRDIEILHIGFDVVLEARDERLHLLLDRGFWTGGFRRSGRLHRDRKHG